jgi:glycosyltransferase involved in cell wall biosynthesis
MVGGGPLATAVEEQARASGAPVEVRGHVDDPTPVMEEAWAVALFSTAEALTFAVQEAMWMGRAVVTSPLAGLEYLVGPGGRTAITAAEARAHFQALSDRETAREEGEAAAARIRSVLGPDDPWPAIEAAYEAWLRAGERPRGWGPGRRRSRPGRG